MPEPEKSTSVLAAMLLHLESGNLTTFVPLHNMSLHALDHASSKCSAQYLRKILADSLCYPVWDLDMKV